MSEPRILTDLELANAQIDRERTPVLVRDLAYTAERERRWKVAAHERGEHLAFCLRTIMNSNIEAPELDAAGCRAIARAALDQFGGRTGPYRMFPE